MTKVSAAYASIGGLALLELVMAVRMSAINAEQMKVIRSAVKKGLSGKEAGDKFLQSTYYKSWSRAQLNHTEYAPMLALLCFIIQYKADKENRILTKGEAMACISSAVFSTMFVYAAATQGRIDHKNLKPGRGGMSPLRPIGAFGRYISMAALIYHAIKF